ncbi:MAG TPA: hypothetical protein VIC85_09350 [Ktedonobacterales bacterium]|jgi:hypothetical protein
MTLEPVNSAPINKPSTSASRWPAVVRRPRATATTPRVSVVDLRVSMAAVSDRAAHLVGAARARGAAHSLRLWRDAQHEALLSLAREAGHAPATAECRSLAWVREAAGYHISAAFTAQPIVH